MKKETMEPKGTLNNASAAYAVSNDGDNSYNDVTAQQLQSPASRSCGADADAAAAAAADADSTTSSVRNNPWNISPSVTAAQSELSADGANIATASASACTESPSVNEHVNVNVNVNANANANANVNSDDSNNSDRTTNDSLGAEGAMLTTTEEMGDVVVPVDEHCQQAQFQETQQHSTDTCVFSPGPAVEVDTEVDTEHHLQADEEGGRLCQAALEETLSLGAAPNKRTASKKRSRFTDSIMERTRSRADACALVESSDRANISLHTQLPGMLSMVTLGGDPGASYILGTALAKKRVQVVQLLLIGVIGLLLGLLGNFFVTTSCHFATVNMFVGQNEEKFEFHFGLWKYSPIDSVFEGYSYCYKYDQNYSNDAPVVARVTNIMALVAGLVAIGILWLYLIFGYAEKQRWKWAVRVAFFAGLVQMSTLSFFAGSLCRQEEYACELGPGAYLSIFTSVVWFVLAFEMKYHTPVALYATGYMDNLSSGGRGAPKNYASLDEPRLLATVELTNIDEVAKEYIARLIGKAKEDEMPTLTTDLKRVRPKSGLHTPQGSRFSSPRGSTYQAPNLTIV